MQRSMAMLLACAMAGACHAPDPRADPDAVPQRCTPEPFADRSLALRLPEGDDCDTNPAACASPCDGPPLVEEWRIFAIEPYEEQLQQIDFASSVVDANGDVFFATCEGALATPQATRSCAFSSIDFSGGFHSALDLSGSFGDRHLTLRGALLAGGYAIVALQSVSSFTLVGVQSDQPRQMWAFTQLGASLVSVHDDPASGRIQLVYNQRQGAVMLGLDPHSGFQVSRKTYPMSAVGSVIDAQGNLTVAFASSDWALSDKTGFVRLLSLDPASCPRWQVDSTWHGPTSHAVRAVSGGLMLALGDRVLQAVDGAVAYSLPEVPAAAVLDATHGFAVTGLLAPGLRDELDATDPVRLYAFDRQTGQTRFRLEFPVGAVKLAPVLTSRGSLLFASTEMGTTPTTVLREVTRAGRVAWACALPHDAQGGYLAGAAITAGRLLTADVLPAGPTDGGIPQPNGIAIRAFKLGVGLAPASRGWVMQGGNPGRGGSPQP